MIKVFVDFDGTISSLDVGGEILRKFASPLWFYWNEVWKSGEIGSCIALQRQFSGVRASFEEIKKLVLDRMEPTVGVVEFFSWLYKNSVPVAIVSDGQDFYINYLLEKWGVFTANPSLEVFSNHSIFFSESGDFSKQSEGGIKVEFPYFNPECPVCGNCKLSHIKRARENYLRTFGKNLSVVYIGDGLSDYCPSVNGADLVFAKRGKDLYRKLLSEGYDVIPFTDFYEVAFVLQRLYSRIFKIPLEGGDKNVLQAL